MKFLKLLGINLALIYFSIKTTIIYFIILVDYYSKSVELKNLKKNRTSQNVIDNCKEIFSRQGIPKIFFTDNRPQFVFQEFKKFSKIWEFDYKTSPRYPQSYGLVERTTQTIKNLLKKAEEEEKDIKLLL